MGLATAHARPRGGTVLAVTAAVLLAACGGTSNNATAGSHGSGAGDTGSSGPNATPTGAQGGGNAIGKTVRMENFVIQLVSWTAPDANNLFKVSAQFKNVAAQPANPADTPIGATSTGHTYSGDVASGTPVAPGATVPEEIDIDVDSNFQAADAVLVFGSGGHNQATVPLGAGGSFVGLTDVSASPPAPVTAGQQTFTFQAATVTAFLQDGSELDKGQWGVRLDLQVQNQGSSSFSLDSGDFTFKVGGQTLQASDVGSAGINPGGTSSGYNVIALVPNYQAGQTLTITVKGEDAQGNEVDQDATLALPALT